jgi:hypothetical protein
VRGFLPFSRVISRKARAAVVLALVSATSVLVACGEELDSTSGCPLVCPQQTLPLRDTIIDAVALDTSVGGYPALGFESGLLLTNTPDSFETRVIVRFDTLPNRAQQSGQPVDSAITHVDTAELVLQIVEADSSIQPKRAYTIELYDVTDVTDTSSAALLSRFRADRLIATQTFEPETAFTATRPVPLPRALVLSRILAREALRIGVRIVSDTATTIRLRSAQGQTGSYLSLAVFSDSITPRTTVATQSRYPADEPFEAAALADYLIVAKAPAPSGADAIRVGGLPATRAYFRFALPPSIVDSAIVVRATLLLHQKAIPSAPDGGKDVVVYPVPILAVPSFIQDVSRLLEFLGPPGYNGLDSITVQARGSGLREVQIGALLRRWIGTDPDVVPRAVVLRTKVDGQFADMVDFYSMEAAPGLRPRLRITYAPRTVFGKP